MNNENLINYLLDHLEFVGAFELTEDALILKSSFNSTGAMLNKVKYLAKQLYEVHGSIVLVKATHAQRKAVGFYNGRELTLKVERL